MPKEWRNLTLVIMFYFETEKCPMMYITYLLNELI